MEHDRAYYQCQICNESFYVRRKLDLHSKSNHSSLKECDLCGVEFKEWALEKHKATCERTAANFKSNELHKCMECSEMMKM